ncbi:MAG: tetratricopeptide repeat protein [Acidobacteriota bacterium]
MTDRENILRAIELFKEAYQYLMDGDLETAVDYYERSIDLYPTAEAHTFLGWTYSFQGKIDQAIAQCERAIQVDPDFGNPYNDIGAYLIEMGKHDEAIAWLERAIVAPRYESYHFPHMNLGRIYLHKMLYGKARAQFERALELAPDYAPARQALAEVRKKLN